MNIKSVNYFEEKTLFTNRSIIMIYTVKLNFLTSKFIYLYKKNHSTLKTLC